MTKKCKGCGKVLETTQFSKRKASPDGLQPKCRDCNRVDNEKFRKVINPQHHAVWQKKNMDRVSEIVANYRKADKGGWIYYIVSPDGFFYIGMTEMYPQVRYLEHRMKYRAYQRGGKKICVGLYDSFDKWGVENHKLGIILEFEDIDRETLREYEKECIQEFMNMNISLNKNI